MTDRARVLLLAVAGMLSATGGVSAQGADQPDANGRGHGLELSASISEAYDDDVPLDLRPVLDPTGSEPGGLSTMLAGSAGYRWQGRRVQAGVNGSSAWRYYGELDELRGISHSAGAGLTARIPWRMTWTVNQTASYAPSYLYTLFPRGGVPAAPGEAPPTAPDYAVGDLGSYTFGTTTTLARAVGRRGSLSGTAELGHTDFLSDDTRRDITVYGISSAFSRGLGRRGAFSATYRYRAGEYIYGDQAVERLPTPEWQTTDDHSLEIGFTFSRPLSATRQAVFGFGIGAQTIQAPALNPGTTLGGGYRLTGHGEFGYQFTRSWQVRASASRGTEYVPGLDEPVLVGGITAAIDGGLTRRVSISGSAGYSQGESALRRDGLTFNTYTGTARISYAATPALAVYGEYLYYFYDFGSSPIAAGLPSGLERNGVRAGLTLRVSALGR